jgi:phage major head subunit gpT-like protein
MPAIQSADLLALNRQVNFQFLQGYTTVPEHWKVKATRQNSSTFQSVYSYTDELPQLRKKAGARVRQGMTVRSFAVTNDPYEFTLVIPRRDIMFDQLGVYSERASQLGRTSARWYEDMVTAVQLANPTCVDGGAFYASSHPVNPDVGAFGTYQNDFTATPLTVDNFWLMVATMMSYKGADGVPLGLTPTVLEVPPALGKKGNDVIANALAAQTIYSGATPVGGAAIQNSIPMLTNVKLHINERLTSATQWYVHSTSVWSPFVVQVALDPILNAQIDWSSPNVLWQDEYVWAIDADGAASVGRPFCSVRVNEV